MPLGEAALASLRAYVEETRAGRARTARALRRAVPHPPRRAMTRQGFWKLLGRYAIGRRHPQAHLAAQAAPLVRHPPGRARRRPARRAGDARPRRHRHDRDLHARVARPPARRLRPLPPARLTSVPSPREAGRGCRERGPAITSCPASTPAAPSAARSRDRRRCRPGSGWCGACRRASPSRPARAASCARAAVQPLLLARRRGARAGAPARSRGSGAASARSRSAPASPLGRCVTSTRCRSCCGAGRRRRSRGR